MKIQLDQYEKLYHQKDGKFVDNWKESLMLLPFDSAGTSRSIFDIKCGLHGVTGEFFRLALNEDVKPIASYDDVSERIKRHLSHFDMKEKDVSYCVEVFHDILYIGNNLNLTDSAFLKYLPHIPNTEQFSDTEAKKYQKGQEKIAEYLRSFLPDDGLSGDHKFENKGTNNLLSQILTAALQTSFDTGKKKNRKTDYYILPHIKEQFAEDLEWMLRQEEIVKVKYFSLFLHFYACYAITQTVAHATVKKFVPIHSSAPFYFILSSEKTSNNHEAVVDGWSSWISRSHLDHLYGKIQALDILNSVLGSSTGFHMDILDKLEETPFQENQPACFELLERCQREKRETLRGRPSEKKPVGEEIDLHFNGYRGFIEKMEEICTRYQSSDYVRLGKKVKDLLSCRFLQQRRGNYVLTLDKDMLIFLTAMLTKGKRTKLENVYAKFKEYGILFNRGSHLAIEEYLLKLNLLDRKSDSGEAQYVTAVL